MVSPAQLKDSVILVIDAQKEYTEGQLPLEDIDDSVQALSVFLQRARTQNVPIVYVVHLGASHATVFNPKTAFVDIIDQLKPLKDDHVIKKNYPDSFHDTNLEEVLQKTGRKSLIITGYMTHMCVSSTTRSAAEKGYACTLVDALTATRNLPDIDGNLIPAKTVKAVCLASLADVLAVVVKNPDQIL